jgi:Rieske Fe-S protein
VNGNVKIGPAKRNLATVPIKVAKTKVTVG